MSRVGFLVGFACSVLALAGCGRHGIHPTAAVSPGAATSRVPGQEFSPGGFVGPAAAWSGFFPLEIGNHWRYTIHSTSEYRAADSSHTYPEAVDSMDLRLHGTVVVRGRAYVDEERSFRGDGLVPWTDHIYMRQDRTGLYEADVPGFIGVAGVRARSPIDWDRIESGLRDAAARQSFRAARPGLERKLAAIPDARFGSFAGPPGMPVTPAPPELTRLAYPLVPHARWVIRSEPLFEAEVLSWQRLNLPGIGSLQGCWIQYTSEVYGPQDAVYVWYGPDGYLGLSARLEVVTPSHTWILWYSERLEGMDLVGRNHP